MMKLTSLTLLLSLAAGAPLCADTIHWSYEGESASEHWGELAESFKTCKVGQFQSPIDIRNAIDSKLPPLGMQFHERAGSIVNNGHTLQITLADGDSFKLDNDTFTLMQFHFHTPAENQIAGKAFPLEAHFVHANKKGELAVIAVLFEKGAENPALGTVLDAVPDELNKVVTLEKRVNPADFMPASKASYRYIGSLTTPPCTEGVRWLVLKQPVTLSETQLKQFEKHIGRANNRPLQPLHGRIIVN